VSSDPDGRLDAVAAALPELGWIESPHLLAAVAEIWAECWRESDWPRLEDVPKSPLEPATFSLVAHTRSVTRQALACAEHARDTYGVGFDRDVLIAAALLHDVSKLVEWTPAGGGSAQTRRGELIQHAVYAAHKAWEKGLSDDLVHVLITHSDLSAKRPASWEGRLIRTIDLLDSEAIHQAAL
jgi:hypothetical protein